METFHVQTQKGSSADSAAGAKAVADKLLLESPGCDLILKAQIHAGGRGKGHFINTGLKGGVKILSKAEEVETNTQTMLGDYLVTKQTSEQGQQVNTVLVNEGISIEKEWYFAILLDRGVGGPVMVVSTEGGMNIEEVAETSPEKIVSIPIDIMSGCTEEHGEQVADAL
jgi:succinyl-CoA synthetase beta subunit